MKGLFDNIPHELPLKAVKHHTNNKMVILYIERWLKAPMERADGTIIDRTKGTPQGSPISPILSNLFLHYVFDVWISRNHPETPWCRYADDGLIHCRNEQQARTILTELK
jgi:RNA-directed DNA polymerase